MARRTQADFFHTVLPYGEGLTDPRVSFDYDSDRFFAVAASGKWGTGCDPNDCPNTWTVAVSKTASPQTLTPDDWFFWAFDATLTEGEPSGLWGDFSIVASDGKLVVINGNMVQHHPGPTESVYERLWVFDKADFLAGRDIQEPAREFHDITDPKTGQILRQRLLPATNMEDPGGIFFAHFGLEDCDIVVAQVSTRVPGQAAGPASSAHLTVRNVAIPGQCRGNSIPGSQLGDGPPINVHPHLTSPPVYQGGFLWVAQVIPAQFPTGPVNAVRVLKLNVTQWPEVPTVEEEFTLAEDGASYAYPALAVNRAGDVAVVLNRFAPSTYISAYYTGRLVTDPAGAFRPLVPFMPGKAYHDYPNSSPNLLSFGGHSGAAADADGTIWLMAQYAERPCIWGGRIAQVSFVDGGLPVSPPAPAPNGGEAPCIETHESPY